MATQMQLKVPFYLEGNHKEKTTTKSCLFRRYLSQWSDLLSGLIFECVPLGWSGSGSVIGVHSDHGKSNEPMNPLWTRIRQFIWSTMIREISHHWSWFESSQRNASISLQNFKRPSDTVCGPWSAKVRDALGPRHFRKSNISSRKKKNSLNNERYRDLQLDLLISILSYDEVSAFLVWVKARN